MKNIKPLTFPFNSENNTSIKQSLFRFREYFDSSTIVGLGEN
ncbi:EreD family erythromycin esterase, partial [Bergeyella sp. RCAD1439]|nr:EreD family erythromycin esterase [Myroides odoratimimus]MEC5396155.1 EreD family erythromycin esterase [Bergeyella sp. RCAD1439]